MSIVKKLQNPFVLVGQGFLVGGLLFWTTQAETKARPAVDAPVATSTTISAPDVAR
jgi:hypothetical protein